MGVEAALIGSSLIGAGSSMSAASKAEEAGKKNLSYAKKAASLIDERTFPAVAQGELYTRKAASAMGEGIDAAEAQVTRGAQAGQRSLRDMGRQRASNAAQVSQSRGMAGTTIGQQAAMASDRALSRDLADYDAQIGSLYADVARQRAMAKSGAYDKMAQFQAYKADALSKGPLAMIGVANNTQFQAPQGFDMSGLGMMLAMMGNKGGFASSPAGVGLANTQAYNTFNNFKGTGLGTYF